MLRALFRNFRPRREADLGTAVQHGNLLVHEMRSRIFGNTRAVRVWLPPDYDRRGSTRYPVFYLNDGQNLFDPATAFAGVHWQVSEAATSLIAKKKIPPLIIVGIDNTGRNRLREYLPYRSRDPKILHPRGACYPEFLQSEIMPLVQRQYRILEGPENTGLGGSSLGGLITLYTQIAVPGVFGKALIESPSLFVANRQILAESRRFRAWPARVYIGMGTREVGDTEKDARTVEDARELASILEATGLDETRLRLHIQEGATHGESAWAARFPEALEFLYSNSTLPQPLSAQPQAQSQPTGGKV